jgi:hypothetical protein
MTDAPSFVCPRCGATSFNPNDIRENYCGRCHTFITDDALSIVIIQAEAAKRGRLTIWTVYERPRDYACGFIARAFEVTSTGPEPTGHVIKCLDLMPIQEKLHRAGLTPLPRDENDEPQIVESWI